MLTGLKRAGTALHGHVRKHAKTYGAIGTKIVRHKLANDRSKAANRRINPTITTTQQDTSTQFKRKKISKSKVRKLKFAKRVIEATKEEQPFSLYHETQLATSQILRVSAANISDQWVAGDGTQFGINYGTLTSTAYDLPYLTSKMRNPLASTNVAVNTGAPTFAYAKDASLFITHNRMSLAVTNIQNFQAVYEIYQFVAADNITQAAFKNPYSAWVTCLTQTDAYISGSVVVPGLNGATPLDAPGFGKYWRLIKKDRVLLGGAQTVEITMSGLHKRRVNTDDLTNNYATKGLTQYFMVVGGIGDNSSFATGPVFGTQITKTWHCKTPGDGINGPSKPIQLYQAM